MNEHTTAIDGAGVCPICAEDWFNDGTVTSVGTTVVGLSVEVPWTTQKAIFKSMCKFKAAAMQQNHRRPVMTKQELEQLKTEDRIFNAFAYGMIFGLALAVVGYALLHG